MPGVWDAISAIGSALAPAALNIGSAFAMKELGLMPQAGVFTGGVPYQNAYQQQIGMGQGFVPVQQASVLGQILGIPGQTMLGPGPSMGEIINTVTTPSGSRVSRPLGGAFPATDPYTGRQVLVRSVGRPILWSSDLSACKRVRKVASRARRRMGGR